MQLIHGLLHGTWYSNATLIGEGAAKDVRRNMPQATIVGGGVIGCFLTYRLARAGETVRLLEKEAPGAGNVQPVTGDNVAFEARLGIESLNLYRKDLPDIKKESGKDPQD